VRALAAATRLTGSRAHPSPCCGPVRPWTKSARCGATWLLRSTVTGLPPRSRKSGGTGRGEVWWPPRGEHPRKRHGRPAG